MTAIDPYKEMIGRRLRNVVIQCLDNGSVLIPLASGERSHAQHRMDERSVTAPEIESALRGGTLKTSSCVAGKWRYLARKGNVEVVFTFDVDDDGDLLVVVTVIRKQLSRRNKP